MSNSIPITHLAVGDFTIVRVPKAEAREEDLQVVAVRLADLAGFEIAQHEEQWLITISTLSQSGMHSIDIARHYSSALIDQKLRRSIAEQTATERNLILSYAFSNTRLINNSVAE